MTKVLFFAPVQLTNLLQTDHIRVELLDRMAQIVNLQASPWAYALDPFVNVVGHHPNGVGHARKPSQVNRKTAAAVLKMKLKKIAGTIATSFYLCITQ
jgi:hypothetical protein